VFDPLYDALPPEERRKNPQYTPGLFVAMALNEAVTKTDKPLTDEDRQDAAAVLAQASQAARRYPASSGRGYSLLRSSMSAQAT
jgi:hypothetical protein